VFGKLKFVLCLVLPVVLWGCTSSNVGDTLKPTPIAAAPQPVQGASTGQTALVAESTAQPAQNAVNNQINTGVERAVEQTEVASLDVGKSISFLPVEGVPQSAVPKLSQSIKESAQVHGLTLVPANKPNGKYRVKGYFSALNDGTGTLVTYIWDVIDSSGKRLHRINGQERNGSTNLNPWQTVTENQLKNVADSTASRLKSWLDGRS